MCSILVQYHPYIIIVFCLSVLISVLVALIATLISIECLDEDEQLITFGLIVFVICYTLSMWFGCGLVRRAIEKSNEPPSYSQQYDALIKQEKINLINQEHRNSIIKFIEESFPTLSEEGKNSLCNHIVTYIANNINLQTNYTIKLMFASEDNVEFYKKNINNLKSIYTDCNTNDLVLEFLLKVKCKEECQTLHDKKYKINSKFVIES